VTSTIEANITEGKKLSILVSFITSKEGMRVVPLPSAFEELVTVTSTCVAIKGFSLALRPGTKTAQAPRSGESTACTSRTALLPW
jgi:hypothetical protein